VDRGRARRADPEGPHGDRNGEPSEADWSCLFVVICAACVVLVLAFLLISAALEDGPWVCYAPCT
jgi:hypothetical protein